MDEAYGFVATYLPLLVGLIFVYVVATANPPDKVVLLIRVFLVLLLTYGITIGVQSVVGVPTGYTITRSSRSGHHKSSKTFAATEPSAGNEYFKPSIHAMEGFGFGFLMMGFNPIAAFFSALLGTAVSYSKMEAGSYGLIDIISSIGITGVANAIAWLVARPKN